MARTDPQLIVRVPSGMRDRIRSNAAINRRSMNAEIVTYLDRALANEEAKGPVGSAIPPGQEHNPTHAKEEADEHEQA